MDLVALLNLGKREAKRGYDEWDRIPGSRRREQRGPEQRKRERAGSRKTAATGSSRAH